VRLSGYVRAWGRARTIRVKPGIPPYWYLDQYIGIKKMQMKGGSEAMQWTFALVEERLLELVLLWRRSKHQLRIPFVEAGTRSGVRGGRVNLQKRWTRQTAVPLMDGFFSREPEF